MKCPICRKPVDPAGPEFPFCSERCRILDLGAWASEKYVVSTPLRPEEAEAQPSPEEAKDEG